MSDEEVRITLRLPTELRDDLKRMADHDGRSMNSEIVSRLEQTLYAEAGGPVADFNLKVTNAAFVRGIQLGTLEFLAASDNPIAEIQRLQERFRKPLLADPYHLDED